MSADLIFRFTISLQKWDILKPEEMAAYTRRVQAGVLIDVPASKADEMLKKHDPDGNGLIGDEIKAVVRDLGQAYLEKNNRVNEAVLNKLKRKNKTTTKVAPENDPGPI